MFKFFKKLFSTPTYKYEVIGSVEVTSKSSNITKETSVFRKLNVDTGETVEVFISNPFFNLKEYFHVDIYNDTGKLVRKNDLL